MRTRGIIDWLLRVVKGMFIGSGAILPGVSGGALAAVFGIYERMIAFLSDIRKDFLENVRYFIPVGIGGLIGIFVLAYPLDYFLQTAEIQVLWAFIGCILGTMPALYREAGKHGRKPYHLAIAGLTAVAAFFGLWFARLYLDVRMPLNLWTWIMAGAIFALGAIVPGMSPSNFLMYFHMYEPMTAGIKDLDFGVIIPVGIGAILCVLAFARLMEWILGKAYTGVFHVILGIVLASTMIIVPLNYSGAGPLVIIESIAVFVVGLAVGLFMGWLERTYKTD